MELGLSLSRGFTRANNLDCWREWVREALHRARRWNAECVFGTATGDSPVCREFDLV